MECIVITLGEKFPLIAFPNIRVNANRRPVLTYTYSLYWDQSGDMDQAAWQAKVSMPEKQDNPDYMGEITFEDPDRLFSYTTNGSRKLSSDQVQQAIEQITYYRDHPALWNI